MKKYLKDNKVLLLLLIVCAFVIFKQRQDISKQERLFKDLVGTETEFKKLKNENAQLAVKYKSQADLHEATKKEFLEVMDAQEKRIKVLSSATFLIAEKARETSGSDVTFVGKYGEYILNEIRFNNGPAVGYVLILKDGKVTSKLYDHEIVINQVVSKDETTGKYKVVAHADYVLKSPALQHGWYKKPYRLAIKSGEALIDPTEPNYALLKRMYWWNPKLNLNLNFMPKPQPGLSVSMMGYGRSVNDQDFKFIDVGVSYDQVSESMQLVAKPILYRPLEKYMSNTYIGPGINLQQNGLMGYHLGLQISF